MTLAEIMRLALRQLDEDPADISDFADMFRAYANLGYEILVSRFLKPKEIMPLQTDGKGEAYIEGMGVKRVASLIGDMGQSVWHRMSEDGTRLITSARNAELTVVYESEFSPMREDTEEPRIPEHAHHALVDYVCYRHLMRGNAAKQSRAMLFYQAFEQTARAIMPQGGGSVTDFKHLYEASDVRNVRW